MKKIYTNYIELLKDLESEIEFILDKYDLDSNFRYACLNIMFFIKENEPEQLIVCSFKTSKELLLRKIKNNLDIFTMIKEIEDSNVEGIKISLSIHIDPTPELNPSTRLQTLSILKIALVLLIMFYLLLNTVYCTYDLEMQSINNDHYSNSISRIIEQLDLNSNSTVHINESYFEEINLNDDTNSKVNFNILRRGNEIISENLISTDRFYESTFRFSVDNSILNQNNNTSANDYNSAVNDYRNIKKAGIFAATSATLIVSTILLIKYLH